MERNHPGNSLLAAQAFRANRHGDFQANLDHYHAIRANGGFKSRFTTYSQGRIIDPYQVEVERSLRGPKTR